MQSKGTKSDNYRDDARDDGVEQIKKHPLWADANNLSSSD
jgi:hypothetical protein